MVSTFSAGSRERRAASPDSSSLGAGDNLLGDPTVKLRTSAPWRFATVNLSVVRDTAFINVPRQPCTDCPQNLPPPEMVTAVAIDPATGRLIGRALINVDGNASIPLRGHTGNFIVRVGSGDGASQQAALVETDGDRDGVPDSRDNCRAVANANQRDRDSDGDGFINALDLAQVRRLFGTRPGPSAWQAATL